MRRESYIQPSALIERIEPLQMIAGSLPVMSDGLDGLELELSGTPGDSWDGALSRHRDLWVDEEEEEEENF
jgi:hypothetical protein